MSTEAMHVLVSGEVQGVAFRWYTRDRARALGLDGWVRNLRDGRVEVLAEGAPAALEQLYAWLATGSPSARVEQRERRARAVQGLEPFDVAPSSPRALTPT